jgi:hypothetical protein
VEPIAAGTQYSPSAGSCPAWPSRSMLGPMDPLVRTISLREFSTRVSHSTPSTGSSEWLGTPGG